MGELRSMLLEVQNENMKLKANIKQGREKSISQRPMTANGEEKVGLNLYKH